MGPGRFFRKLKFIPAKKLLFLTIGAVTTYIKEKGNVVENDGHSILRPFENQQMVKLALKRQYISPAKQCQLRSKSYSFTYSDIMKPRNQTLSFY